MGHTGETRQKQTGSKAGTRRGTKLLLTLVSALALACLSAPTAFAAEVEFELHKVFGPDGTGATDFGSASSVAVDQSADILYVLDAEANALFKFDLEGNPVNFGGSGADISGNELSGLAIGSPFPGERQVAVNPETHTIYLTGESNAENLATALQAFKPNGEPALFTAGPGAGTNMIGGFPFLKGVAVDANGSIYTADRNAGISIYSSSGEVILPTIAPGGPSFPANIAVDRNGALYAQSSSDSFSKFTPSQYPVTPETKYTGAPELVDPNGSSSIAVDPATNDVYVAERGPGDDPLARVAVYDEAGAPQSTFAGPGEEGELKEVSGIAVANVKEQAFAFVADSPSGGPSQVKIFKEKVCECPPEIESTSAGNVTGDSATLRAKINPGNLQTSVWFEYGLADCAVGPCTKVPAGGESIGSGRKGVAVQFGLAGLQPGTTYHFRAVAKNSKELRPGLDKTFTTQTSGLGAALSDSRAWEMVSPPKKFGGTILSRPGTAIQAAAGGGKIAYASIGSVLEDPISNRVPEPTSILAERGAGGQWSNRDLTPPHSEASGSLRGETEFKLFTPNLGRAEMEPRDSLPLSPEASERTPYRWSDGITPSFTPLLDPSNIPPGTKISLEQVTIAGASPDLEQIAINSSPALLAGVGPEALYMWEGGALEAVSEPPSSEGGAIAGGVLGSGYGSVRHAISDDGARAFWTGGAGLYLRDRVAGESVRLDKKATGGSGTGTISPTFNGASADGRVVFFTDTQHLTAKASPNGRDLYRCEIGPVEGGGLGCASLSDLTIPLAGSGESSEVLEQLPAISEDGKSLFFVSRGVLDKAANEEGEAAAPGEPNLYHWQEGQGTRFVARLAKEDSLVWGQTATGSTGYAINISATISPNGRYLAFTSQKSLTGYENQNAADQATTEVYLYDTEAGADQLACISCNPSGAAAVGEQLPKKVALFPPDPGGLWAERWVAATLPQATQSVSSGPSLYRPRSVLDNGRVYFNSVDPLVASDSNGDWDVYQYEPVGVGSCAANTNAATQTRSGSGCVGLLSSGSAAGDAGFLDASSSGEDVFFLTRSRLSVLDKDEDADVYDARVNGIPAVLTPVQECAGEACQPSVGPPNDPTPASESFKGAETPLVCRKGQRKVRRVGREICVKKKQAKHKHKSKKRKQAKKNGGAAR